MMLLLHVFGEQARVMEGRTWFSIYYGNVDCSHKLLLLVLHTQIEIQRKEEKGTQESR